MATAPAGYKYVVVYLMGSNTSRITTTVCLRCGCTVGDTAIHNNWHRGNVMTPSIEEPV